MLVSLLVLARVRIVLAQDAVSSSIYPSAEADGFPFFMKKYTPLINALLIISIMTMLLCRFFEYDLFSMMGMNMLMGSWFLIFGVTKFFDISGFFMSFRQYDIITKKIPLYGYLYPVIEFILGIAYIFDHSMTYWLPINIVTILIS